MRTFLAFLFLLALPALGEECKEVDYRPQLGPPRNQNDTSWCFAFSAADLISQATGKRVSPYDLATTYLLGDPERLRSIPDPRLQDYLLRNPSFFSTFLEARKNEDENKIRLADKILSEAGLADLGGEDDHALLMANTKGLCLESRLPEVDEIEKILGTVRRRSIAPMQVACESGHKVDPVGPVTGPMAAIMAASLQKWIDESCQPRIPIQRALIPRLLSVADDADSYVEAVKARRLNHKRQRELLFREIDKALDSGKAASVGYSAYDFYKDDKDKNKHADHSSVIAARKKIKGVCHYFVRNHFGQDCDYFKRFKCDKKNGGIWVKASDFKTLYSVISLE